MNIFEKKIIQAKTRKERWKAYQKKKKELEEEKTIKDFETAKEYGEKKALEHHENRPTDSPSFLKSAVKIMRDLSKTFYFDASKPAMPGLTGIKDDEKVR